jgi:hypothetical protein
VIPELAEGSPADNKITPTHHTSPKGTHEVVTAGDRREPADSKIPPPPSSKRANKHYLKNIYT